MPAGEDRQPAVGFAANRSPRRPPGDSPIDRSKIGRPAAQTSRRRHAAALATALLALGLLFGSLGAPVASAATAKSTDTVTATDIARMIQTSMNDDRVANGLVPYRGWGALVSLATERAQRMADKNVLSHDVAGGNVGDALTANGIPWMGFGETIGVTGWPWGRQAADSIYHAWVTSGAHRSIMFSSSYNYIGIGVVRSKDGSTWVSAVFTESPDHTAPQAANSSISRSGTSISFSWSGRDPQLQTHTAGLRSFDVAMSVDGGAWRTIRNDTTATSLVLANRVPGHTYAFRVQAADRRGTLSRWTLPAQISIP